MAIPIQYEVNVDTVNLPDDAQYNNAIRAS
jgi:hypothetical protein